MCNFLIGKCNCLNLCTSLPTGKDDIVDGNLTIILGLIWQLIRHYNYFGETGDLTDENKQADPKGTLLAWLNQKLSPTIPISDLTTSWHDGRAIGALVDALAPGTYHYHHVRTRIFPLLNISNSIYQYKNLRPHNL